MPPPIRASARGDWEGSDSEGVSSYKIFVMHEKLYYNKQHWLKESLGLSDDDVCRANADAEHEATAKCEPLVPPT